LRRNPSQKERASQEVFYLLDRLVEKLEARFGEKLVSVVLFGSFARGDFHPLSDIDLLLVIEDLPPSRFQRSRLFDDVEREVEDGYRPLRDMGYLGRIVPILKTPEEASHRSPLYLDMVEDAKILYDRGGFFREVLEGLRRRLSELGAKRKFLKGGGWYWDLKPDYRFGEVFEI